jgi:hypothetical protein
VNRSLGLKCAVVLALTGAAMTAGTADARRFRIGVIPVPHFSRNRDDSQSSSGDGQHLEEAHDSVTLDENGNPVPPTDIDWMPILLVLGGAALSITMVKFALKSRD